MSATSFRIGCTVLLGLAGGCGNEGERAATAGTSAPPDSAAATAALDTLSRLGAKDYVVDSLVRRADTATVWTGPRVWMATDRPTSVVTVVAPARVVSIRQILEEKREFRTPSKIGSRISTGQAALPIF